MWRRARRTTCTCGPNLRDKICHKPFIINLRSQGQLLALYEGRRPTGSTSKRVPEQNLGSKALQIASPCRFCWTQNLLPGPLGCEQTCRRGGQRYLALLSLFFFMPTPEVNISLYSMLRSFLRQGHLGEKARALPNFFTRFLKVLTNTNGLLLPLLQLQFLSLGLLKAPDEALSFVSFKWILQRNIHLELRPRLLKHFRNNSWKGTYQSKACR